MQKTNSTEDNPAKLEELIDLRLDDFANKTEIMRLITGLRQQRAEWLEEQARKKEKAAAKARKTSGEALEEVMNATF